MGVLDQYMPCRDVARVWNATVGDMAERCCFDVDNWSPRDYLGECEHVWRDYFDRCGRPSDRHIFQTTRWRDFARCQAIAFACAPDEPPMGGYLAALNTPSITNGEE